MNSNQQNEKKFFRHCFEFGIGILFLLLGFVVINLQAITPFIGIVISLFSIEMFHYVFRPKSDLKKFEVLPSGKAFEASVKLFGNLALVASVFSNLLSHFFPIPEDVAFLETLFQGFITTSLATLLTMFVYIAILSVYKKRKEKWYKDI